MQTVSLFDKQVDKMLDDGVKEINTRKDLLYKTKKLIEEVKQDTDMANKVHFCRAIQITTDCWAFEARVLTEYHTNPNQDPSTIFEKVFTEMLAEIKTSEANGRAQAEDMIKRTEESQSQQG